MAFKTLIIKLDKYASPSRQGEDVFSIHYLREHSVFANEINFTRDELYELAKGINTFLGTKEKEEDGV